MKEKDHVTVLLVSDCERFGITAQRMRETLDAFGVVTVDIETDLEAKVLSGEFNRRFSEPKMIHDEMVISFDEFAPKHIKPGRGKSKRAKPWDKKRCYSDSNGGVHKL